MQLLEDNGHSFDTIKQEKSIFIRDIKEKLARTSPHNLQHELDSHDDADIEDKAFVLPDGKVIELDKTLRYTMGEILVK